MLRVEAAEEAEDEGIEESDLDARSGATWARRLIRGGYGMQSTAGVEES